MTAEQYGAKIAGITWAEPVCAIPVVLVNAFPFRAAPSTPWWDHDDAILSLVPPAALVLAAFLVFTLEVWKFRLRRERNALIRAGLPASDEVVYPRG